MTLAVLQAMLRGLTRDRGALALSFVLPAVFFLVFATIFVGGGGGDGPSPSLRVALGAQDADDATARRLLDSLAREGALTPVTAEGAAVAGDATFTPLTPDQVRELVRGGDADAGLIVVDGQGLLTRLLEGDGGESIDPALIVVKDPARAIASQVLSGLTQKALFTALPDQMLSFGAESFETWIAPLSPEQRESLEDVQDRLEGDLAGSGSAGDMGLDFGSMFATEAVAGTDSTGGTGSLAAYYAGAIAVLFMLFASFGGASLLHDELDRGILDRILAGPGGLAPLLTGKLAYLVVLGSLQVLEIFLIAWLLYGVPFAGRGVAFAAATLATAFACAGIGLLLVTACRTKAQAAAVSTIAILLASALGGSMVPRFLMPDWMRSLGWVTPNAWAIEAYTSIFWRGDPLGTLATPVAVLVGFGAVSFVLARLLARRWTSA